MQAVQQPIVPQFQPAPVVQAVQEVPAAPPVQAQPVIQVAPASGKFVSFFIEQALFANASSSF